MEEEVRDAREAVTKAEQQAGLPLTPFPSPGARSSRWGSWLVVLGFAATMALRSWRRAQGCWKQLAKKQLARQKQLRRYTCH